MACGQDNRLTKDGRIVIDYWEKWSNFEKDAMAEIVQAYNASQDEVYVNFVSQSEYERKLLLAISGGTPPDVAGFWSYLIPSYTSMGALRPLDRFMDRDGVSADDYVPSVFKACRYHGFTWGLPATPASVALHYDRAAFREAGLDPDRPPRSLAELDEAAKLLTIQRKDGGYTRMGFLPSDPGWWLALWSFWFGDGLVSEDGRELTCDSPETIACLEWQKTYTTDYDFKAMRIFEGAYRGQFASASNSFMSGCLPMKLQGVWMANFIERFAPEMEWDVAPFPAAFDTGGEPVTIVEADVLVIPTGSPHPEEAWDFIKFVQQRENMERLCTLQYKFSPLIDVSPEFYENHPNPHVRLFRELAESKNARIVPQIPVWTEYRDELTFAYQQIWTDPAAPTPAEALRRVKERIQPRLDEANARWDRAAKARVEEWRKQ